MSVRKIQQKTLSDKVTDIILKRGDEGSSEEDNNFDDNKAPKIVDFDDEYSLPDKTSSDFRKRNVKLLSEQSSKYRGKITSRKELDNDGFSVSEDEQELKMSSSESNFEENDSDAERKSSERNGNEWEASSDELDCQEKIDSDSNKSKTSRIKDNLSNSSDHVNTENSESDGDDDEYSGSDDSGDSDKSNIAETQGVFPETNKESEIQKGACVQHQLHLWEKLLEMRIHSQQILNKANLLPSPEEYTKIVSQNSEFLDISKESSNNLENLLTTLLDLQTMLIKQFPEFKDTIQPTRKRTSQPNQTSEEPPIKKFGIQIANNFTNFRSSRNSALLKWDDRTKLLKPGWASRKKLQNEEFDIIQKIDNVLMNKAALVKKSQTVKKQLSAEENNEDQTTVDIANVNIYDDTDFYHQQLRELIESKTSSSNDAANIANQYVELQKLRQKMKKKIDTRASKGRKMRYLVHNKLINFMAPNDPSEWTEESKNKLYKSLFMT